MGDDLCTRLVRENLVCVWSEQGPRSYNEDTVLLYARHGMLVAGVFDGHGGSDVSRFLVPTFEALLDKMAAGGLPVADASWCAAIESLFDDADRLMAQSLSSEQYRHTGSTASMAFVVPDKHGRAAGRVFFANTRDSRTSLYSQSEAAVVHETSDHTLDTFEETDRIKRAGGWGSPAGSGGAHSEGGRRDGTLATSRSFGDYDAGPGLIYSPDVTGPHFLDVFAGPHFLISATDGLHDVLSSDELQHALRALCSAAVPSCTSARTVATALWRRAKTKGLVDNTTVVVVQL